MDSIYLGLDIGGTRVKACLINHEKQVLSKVSRDTGSSRPKEIVLAEICHWSAAILASQAGTRLGGIGVGVCGPVNCETGTLITSPIILGWDQVPLKQYFAEKFHTPVVVDNDANLAIYGEAAGGAAQNMRSVVGFTLGTGVGGGIVLNGELYRGSHWYGGELGHMTVQPGGAPCPCGNKGCLTMEASSKKLIAGYQAQTLQTASMEQIFAEGLNQQEPAGGIVSAWINAVSMGVANLLNVFDPDCFVLAGGVVNSGERLLTRIQENVRQRVFPGLFQAVKISFASLGDYSGAIGAANLAVDEVKRKKP